MFEGSLRSSSRPHVECALNLERFDFPIRSEVKISRKRSHAGIGFTGGGVRLRDF